VRLFLTKRGEYGIRALLHLAAIPSGERRTASELAEACEIPAGNVPTIVNILARSGLLACSPGRGGGCSLARDPADISMLEIIEALEGQLEVPHCLLDSRRCHDRDPECAVHAAWSLGRDAAIGALSETSLADTLTREREIAALGSSTIGVPSLK
jgi:Rrf2 family transcriptional regulator, iron-sulfur cluster assembly transcription factor